MRRGTASTARGWLRGHCEGFTFPLVFCFNLHISKIIHGDVQAVETLLTVEERASIGCVAGGSIFNEFFHNDSSRAVALLRKLRGLFPYVPLVIGDYYGSLFPESTAIPPPSTPGEAAGNQASLLHDGITSLSPYEG